MGWLLFHGSSPSLRKRIYTVKLPEVRAYQCGNDVESLLIVMDLLPDTMVAPTRPCLVEEDMRQSRILVATG